MHGDDYLSDADCIKLRLGMMCSLSAYWWLRFDHMLHNPPTQSNLKVWKPKPKQHQWCHLVELFIIPTRINPRKTWCYMNEDYVGHVKHLIKMSPKKTYALTAMRKNLKSFSLRMARLRDGLLDVDYVADGLPAEIRKL